MSIASIVKGNDFPEFKGYLKTYSPVKKRFTSSTGYPPFSKDIPIRVPAANITSHESGHIGELADFLFCLEIARYVDINKELIFIALHGALESFLMAVSGSIEWRKTTNNTACCLIVP